MTGSIKAALCAASLLCAPAVQAATIYQIDTVGTGTFYGSNRGGGNPNVFNVENVSFQYVIADGQVFGSSNGTSNFITGFGSGVATTQGIRIGERGPNIAGASVDVCFANAGQTFQLPNGNVPGFCGGSISYQTQGSAFPFGSYTGTIVGFSSFQGTALPTGNGASTGFVALAVPEPSTWALMLAGFGLTGYALRRRRSTVAFA